MGRGEKTVSMQGLKEQPCLHLSPLLTQPLSRESIRRCRETVKGGSVWITWDIFSEIYELQSSLIQTSPFIHMQAAITLKKWVSGGFQRGAELHSNPVILVMSYPASATTGNPAALLEAGPLPDPSQASAKQSASTKPQVIIIVKF